MDKTNEVMQPFLEETNEIMQSFLDEIKKDGTPLKIIIKNGHPIMGTLVDWDSQVLIVNVIGVHQMVFLSAVSTIIPIEA